MEEELEDDEEERLSLEKRKRAFNRDIKAGIKTKRGRKPKKPKVVALEVTKPTWIGLGIPRLFWPGVKKPVAAVYGVEGSWGAEIELPGGGPPKVTGTTEVREDCQARALRLAERYWGTQYKIAV